MVRVDWNLLFVLYLGFAFKWRWSVFRPLLGCFSWGVEVISIRALVLNHSFKRWFLVSLAIIGKLFSKRAVIHPRLEFSLISSGCRCVEGVSAFNRWVMSLAFLLFSWLRSCFRSFMTWKNHTWGDPRWQGWIKILYFITSYSDIIIISFF
jgi:hypothetical protein